MVSEGFFLLDADYIIDNNAPIVRLFGRTSAGKSIVCLDNSFEPYFYVVPKEGKLQEALQKIKSFEINENGTKINVKKVHIVEKLVGLENQKLLKIFAYLPRDVPILRQALPSLESVKECREYDILFVRKYLIDKKLSPLGITKVSGEQSISNNCQTDIAIKISEISQEQNAAQKTESGEKINVAFRPKLMAFDLETYQTNGKNTVIMASVYSNDGYKKLLTYEETGFAEEQIVKNEKDLIEKLGETIRLQDPDFLITYNGDSFDLSVLDERAKHYGIKIEFGRFGSLNLRTKGRNIEAQTIGRPHIDLFRFFSVIMRAAMNVEVMTLDNVANTMLGMRKLEMNWEKLAENWANKTNLDKIAEYCLHDSKLTLMLAEQVLQNIFALSTLVGGTPSDACRMTYGQLVESFALKKASEFNIIVPNKPSDEILEERRQEDAYEGAFVLEPLPGLHKNISVFDFRSLYPSIIVSHNIELDTLNCSCCKTSEANKVPGKAYYFCTKRKGFIPTVLEELVNARIAMKKKLKGLDKNSQEHKELNADSFAIKTVANSFYGFLGFAASRWYKRECAESVTAFGRDYIHKVVDIAKKHGFTVIYGDTDSIFLTISNDLENKSKEFLKNANSTLPGIMELDYQGTYKSGIFVSKKGGEGGVKKKYALLDNNGHVTVKGFERVRRDWSQLARETQQKVLELVLDDKKDDAVLFVKEVISKLKTGKVSLKELGIYTTLTMSIKSYQQIGPHVAAAQKAINRGKKVHSGDTLQYVITKGKPKDKISDKAELLEYAKDYDADYYINNQIVPAALRALSVFGIIEEDLLGKSKQSGLLRFSMASNSK